MATVEQRDPQSAALATLSNSLDIFNDFKDDKDSDEESFHLPLLDCDDDNDDLDSNNKDGITSEATSNSNVKDTQCQNGESEDDILNKFETRGTPDIDPKIEDKLLLDDIDDLCGNKYDDVNVEKISLKMDTLAKENNQETPCIYEKEETSEKDNEESVTETKEIGTEKQKAEELSTNKIAVTEFKANSDENGKVADEQQETTTQNATEDSVIIEDEKMIADEEKLIADEEKLLQEDEVSDETDQTMKNKFKDTEVTQGLENDTNIAEVENNENKTEHNENSGNEIEDIPTKNFTNDNEKNEVVATAAVGGSTQEFKEVVQVNRTSVNETLNLSDVADKNVQDQNLNKSTEEDVTQEKEEVRIESNLLEKMDVDSVEPETGSIEPEINNSQITPNQVENITENNEKLDSKTDAMDTDVIDSNENKELKTDEKDHSDDNKEDCTKENVNNIQMGGSTTECKKSEDKSLVTSTELNRAESNQKESAVLTESVKQQETDHSKTENVGPDRCENSNDSSKSQNLECDDLLDISIIRDADEDNASAIAENAKDAHSGEKSDNEDQDEGSEKADNELDESEMEQEENLLATDKDDHMDFEDGNSSNLADHENTESGSTSDSESKDDTDMGDSENDSNVSSAVKEKTNKINETAIDGEKKQTDEIRTEPVDDSTKSTVTDDQDSVKENSLKTGGKRPISETENDTEAASKKIKLSEKEIVTEKRKTKKVKTLLTFERYMQNKKFENKLTRSDLEQFCLQKICEAIMHKTDVGELHQTIKKQEQIIENLRKDLQQLTKQTRDLDIVNKKLMNELRSQNGIKKPLVPLKITRSVGLQVKLNINVENNCRRKTPVVTNSRTPTPNTNTTPRQRTITPANAGVVRQVATSPRKPPTTTTTTPLLSQALQNNRQVSPANTVKRPPIRPKPAEPQKPNNPGVIDLTDEDDKASKTTTTASKTTTSASKTTTSASKTPTATPVKIINKTIPISQAKTINIIPSKTTPNKTTNTNNQNKTIAVGQVKSSAVATKVTAPTRTVTTLPQGVRLTPTQVKNGSITIPASVVTSSSGTTQLMYVVQPTSSLGQVVTSTAGGTQKAVLLNFQPTNGVLTSALNGSAVSVIPTKTTNTVQLKTVAIPRKHPAPLPTPPPVAVNASLKPVLPKPHLSIRKTDTGIILQWRMPYNLDIYEGIASYQLFAYQETNAAPSTDMWRKVGDVKALALPMACTLTQFADKNKYYFAVRSVDVHKRIGAFSDPEEISL